MEDKARIIELIQKCLALSKSSNEHEAALALSKAQELLAKYNLDMAQVEVDGKPADETVVDCEEVDQRWQATLVWAIAQGNFCHTVFDPRRNRIHIFGRSANVAAVRVMWQWVLPQVINLMGRQPRIGRKSYVLGLIATIKERLAAPKTTPQSMALVTRLAQEAKELSWALFPTQRKAQRSQLDPFAFDRGKRDGNNIRFSGVPQVEGRLLLR